MKMIKIAAIAIASLFLMSAIVLPITYNADTTGSSSSDEIKENIYKVSYNPVTDIVKNTGTTQLPATSKDYDGYTVTVRYELMTTANNPTAVIGNSTTYAQFTYPGALVQGNSDLANGTPNQVLTTDRSDLNYSISLPGVSGFKVNPQNYNDVKNAINEKVKEWENNQSSLASVYSMSYTEAHSQTQVSCDLGLTAEQLLKLNISAGWNEDGSSTTYVMKFVQVYYTVSITMLNSAEKYFGPNQTWADLNKYIYDKNMAVVVNNVTYGSMVYAKITSNDTTEEAKEALSMTICGNDESLTADQKKIVDNSSMTLAVYGGNYTNIPNTVKGVRKMIQDTSITKDNIETAAPIEYSTAFITDGTIACCNNNASYNAAVKTITNEIKYTIDFGGGYVGNSHVSWKSYDKIDEKGDYVDVKKHEEYHDGMSCGLDDHFETTFSAKHLIDISIESLWGSGYSACISNVTVRPENTLYIYLGGPCCDIYYRIEVDGKTVYEA